MNQGENQAGRNYTHCVAVAIENRLSPLHTTYAGKIDSTK